MTAETFQRHMAGTSHQVMAFLLEVEQWPLWQPTILRIIHLSDRPVRSGTVWLDARPLGQREVKFTARTVEVAPPHIFAYALEGGGLEATVRWSVHEDDEGVLVTQEVEVDAIGLRGLVMDIKRQFLSNQRATMDHLHNVLGGRA